MEKAPIVIKGNKSGLRILLDNSLSFDELLQEIEKKFSESSKFLGNTQVAVSFEGRDLSDEEEAIILQTISDHSQLDIVCIIDNDKKREEYFTRSLNERLAQMDANSGQFFKGNLRSGQVMEFDTSIVILGDVNAGAHVVSTGNIVILGALNGTVYAGASGKPGCFVVALKMNPMQIRIGDVIARAADQKTEMPKEPQIAYVNKGDIYIDELSRQTLKDIDW